MDKNFFLSGCDHIFSDQGQFLKMVPENINVITNIKSYHERDEVLQVFNKHVVNCSNGRIKYKLSAVLNISYLT